MADKKDDTTRQRLNWAIAQEWAFRLQYLVLPHLPLDSEHIDDPREHLNLVIAEMKREA